MIADYLFIGRENATPGRDLARRLHCNIRDVTAMIERERRQGQPICASYDPGRPGYYLAANAADLHEYCRILNKRAAELTRTHSALIEAAATMEG